MRKNDDDDGYDSDQREDNEAEKNKHDPLYPANHWPPNKKVREQGKGHFQTRNLLSFRYKYNRFYLKTGHPELPGGRPGTSLSDLKGVYSRAVNYNKETVDKYVVVDLILKGQTSFRGEYIYTL
jgi:hypothetical protein